MQTVINTILHHFARRTLQTYETAGVVLPNCDEEGPCTISDVATHLLRSTGCMGEGHGPNKIPPNYDLLIHLHTSTTVEKLTNRSLLLIGYKNIILGSELYTNSPNYKLPYTCMALGATMVSSRFLNKQYCPTI